MISCVGIGHTGLVIYNTYNGTTTEYKNDVNGNFSSRIVSSTLYIKNESDFDGIYHINIFSS